MDCFSKMRQGNQGAAPGGRERQAVQGRVESSLWRALCVDNKFFETRGKWPGPNVARKDEVRSEARHRKVPPPNIDNEIYLSNFYKIKQFFDYFPFFFL